MDAATHGNFAQGGDIKWIKHPTNMVLSPLGSALKGAFRRSFQMILTK